MQRLSQLKTKEVSLVPQGANNKKFAVLKEGKPAAPAAGKSVFEKIREVLKSFGKKPENDSKPGEDGEGKGLTPQAQTALEAVGRILAPHKEEITDRHVDAVQDMVGIKGGGENHQSDQGEGPGDRQGSGDPDRQGDGDVSVKPEHMNEAMEKANDALRDHLKKLGYQKYPEGKLRMAKAKKTEDEPGVDDDDEEDDVGKEAPKQILKADGSVDLEAVPAEMRPLAEVILKQQAEATAKAKASEEKAAKLEKELADGKASARKAEIASIAKSFTNLKADDSALMLELADAAGAEKFDAVKKSLEAQNAQMGKLFTDVGSPMARTSPNGPASVENQFDKAVDNIVQKSVQEGKPISKAKAMADFMNTPAGAEMYAQFKNERAARGGA